MREQLVRLWSLPWPGWLRAWMEWAITRSWLQRLFFPEFLVGVAGVIENEQGQILLLRHTYRQTYSWWLPSGFLEHGEQPAEALEREIREETGMRVEVDSVLDARVDERRAHLSIYLRGLYREGSFRPSAEVADARFFPPSELPPLPPFQGDVLRLAGVEEVRH